MAAHALQPAWRWLAEQGPGPQQLSLVSLALGAALILLASGVSLYLSLGLQKPLLVSALRCAPRLGAQASRLAAPLLLTLRGRLHPLLVPVGVHGKCCAAQTSIPCTRVLWQAAGPARPRQHGQRALAPRRCVVQLMLLGYILVPIFDLDAWWLNLLYALFMLGVASVEAVSRPPAAYTVRPWLPLALLPAVDRWPVRLLVPWTAKERRPPCLT